MAEVRPIDANKHIKYLTEMQKVCEKFNDSVGVVSYQVALNEIRKADTLRNYEPVVHCKDCKHHVMFKGRIMCSRVAVRVQGNYYGLSAVKKNHFCSYGAKMEEKEQD